ncbi:2100_t:CDS:2 [Dentiscutata erythropus]|uniref:2100_t:CDS:1 n=1 Tax=Dentiscutata erythropus TaxID=1348616 RepID=A0A9N9IUR7_9GLOM|nr:2100_t:CDS:2 [Dentiscutata erythropus]
MVHNLFTTRSPSTSPPVLARWTNDFDDRRFIDALIYTAIYNGKDAVFSLISLEDWSCGILSTIGMIM